MYNATDLIKIFNTLFISTCNTELMAGGEEPIYLPASDAQQHHRIVFTRDYFSSALHEISHWCVAGPQRRQQVDFGYWYEPEGRLLQQQKDFEAVELKPQALEWIFSAAAGIKFRVSVDNFNVRDYDSSGFTEQVRQQARRYLLAGLPARAQNFTDRLIAFYQQQQAFNAFYDAMVGPLNTDDALQVAEAG